MSDVQIAVSAVPDNQVIALGENVAVVVTSEESIGVIADSDSMSVVAAAEEGTSIIAGGDSMAVITPPPESVGVVAATAISMDGAMVGSLDDLSDVDTSSVPPTDDQVLTWDQAASKWVPSDNINAGAVNSIPIPAYADSLRVDNCVYVPESTWNAITAPITRTLYIVTPTADGGAASLYYYPSSITDLPAIGAAFLGGYYGGLWSENADGVATHVLIVAPRPSGQSIGDWTTVSSFVTTTNNSGLNGYSDWKIPSRNELDILYQELKPSTALNSTSFYINPNSVPKRTTNRTSSIPTQTSATLFKTGAGQDFVVSGPALYYWSSNGSSNGRWNIEFQQGVHADLNLTQAKNVRLVRKVAL